ncbi:heterokaryon incompatibility protein-domain-containing protein [Xylariaceae sp. FL0255]|nr:heterokaryon incompatibility protein-domain-containing protein [Xylariaceae sp. FL0255]
MSSRKSLSTRFSKLLHRNSGSRKYNENETLDKVNDGLCHICTTIGFDNEEGSDKRVWELGFLSEIKERSFCPFCQLVLEAMEDTQVPRMRPNDHYETHVVRVFRDSPHRYSIQPLPSYSKVVFGSAVKGFDRFASSREIDLDMVKNWLKTCDSEHKKCIPNEGPFNVDLSFFRCVDVIDMCIVPLPITARYVALSYTWGPPEKCTPFLMLKKNKDELFTRGGITKNWESIPKTLQDSINLVRKLDCRYVWIDQVCFIQDDDEDKGIGIVAMDLVYEQAYCTIIAASGTDANSGLPGIRENSRTSSHQVTSEVLPGIKLVLRHTREDLIANAFYQSRGWTFQEYYLSRRKLIFINDTIYFQCLEESYQELEDGLPVRPDPTREQGQILSKPGGDVYHLLGQLLVKYSTRNLGFQSDQVVAMAGICRRLADYAQCTLLFGNPVPAIDWFLLFYPGMKGLKRRDIFPTWSWAGWFGQIYYNYGSGNVTKWTTASTWINWYKREPSGEVALISDGTDRRKAKANELFGTLCDTIETEPTREVVDGGSGVKYTMLQFWTVSTKFSLRKIEQEQADRTIVSYGLYWTPSTHEVIDKNGVSCGFVTLDDPDSPWKNNESVELILLSLSAEKKLPTGDTAARYLWVLMIEWQDAIAERKGVGKINRDALTFSLEPGMSWKQILLS